ncbi:MAG: hypothetical protein V5A55_09830 [Halovenus sp.]
MGTVDTTLEEEAETIFSNLGYTVTEHGGEFRAERKWRVVQVTPMAEPAEPPVSGEYRCFVTWADQTTALERRLERENPDYDWAIIGIRDGEEYVVQRCRR